MTEKIEVNLTFQDFATKNKSVLELKQLDAENYKKLLTCKAVLDQTKDFGFSDGWNKELTDKVTALDPLAKDELKAASDNIDTYLFNFAKAVFEYHRPVMEVPSDNYIKGCAKKLRGLVAASGVTLDPESLFGAIKVLYIGTDKDYQKI